MEKESGNLAEGDDWGASEKCELTYLLVYWQNCGGLNMQHFKFDLTWDEVVATMQLRVAGQEDEFVVVDMRDVDRYFALDDLLVSLA